MKPKLIEYIRCIYCRGGLELKAFETAPRGGGEPDEIMTGLLSCKHCGAAYPVTSGIPRMLRDSMNDHGPALIPFLDKHGLTDAKKQISAKNELSPEIRQVKESFELQWEKWGMESRIFGMDKKENFDHVLANMFHPDMKIDEMKGRLICEAGCGHGMLVEALAERCGEIIGFDVGEGIRVAYARGNEFPNTHYIQASVLTPPFEKSTFDFLFSRGVIHHTPNTRLAFAKLAEIVTPGGYYSIWVYPIRGAAFETVTKAARAVTTRLPRKTLYHICRAIVPLLTIFPAYSGTSLKNSNWRQCSQVAFDFLAPKYQTHHSEQEVREWFEEECFDKIASRPDPISMTGRKRNVPTEKT
ncbi:MAG TPA: methyltransferase domain-containing protein [bacterium]|nr:methyltransferase domain-containing protein [bacterium]